MSEQISRAIEVIKGGDFDVWEIQDARNMAIQALQVELDRQENKALTLEELKEMVGEPVYLDLEKKIKTNRGIM